MGWSGCSASERAFSADRNEVKFLPLDLGSPEAEGREVALGSEMTKKDVSVGLLGEVRLLPPEQRRRPGEAERLRAATSGTSGMAAASSCRDGSKPLV